MEDDPTMFGMRDDLMLEHANNEIAVKDKKKLFQEKAKKGKLKVTNNRYGTRPRGESSRQHEVEVESSRQHEVEVESSTDSDDVDFDELRDSDNEIPSEEDDAQFDHNVVGDPNFLNEWDEMGFEGDISDDEQCASDELCEMIGSSDEDGEDRGRFPVKCRKMYSRWKEFNQTFDTKNPTFELGMEFLNSEVFKKAIKKHSILTKNQVIFNKNTRQKDERNHDGVSRS